MGGDTLSGGPRMDVLDGGLGSDILSVGLGIDTFIFEKSGRLPQIGKRAASPNPATEGRDSRVTSSAGHYRTCTTALPDA